MGLTRGIQVAGHAVQSLLGSGGTDEGFRAKDDHLRRAVTVKLLHDFIVIGGLSQMGRPPFKALRAEAPPRTIGQFAAETLIVPARRAWHVGVLGAASEVRQAIQ